MAKPWASSVRENGNLTVHNGLTGQWVHVFEAALQLFNHLGLAVKVTQAKDQRSANVVMRVADGVATYEHDGTPLSQAFDGTRLHGHTMLIGREGREELEKAAAFMPSNPRSAPMFRGGKTVYEKATLDMMKVIAVHELIHACGLDNKDHATDDGLFYFPLAPDGRGKIIVPAAGKEDKPMPPLRLDGSTVSKIASLWGA